MPDWKKTRRRNVNEEALDSEAAETPEEKAYASNGRRTALIQEAEARCKISKETCCAGE
jgi:hypothetical protein